MIGYGEPSSRSVTSTTCGCADQTPVPPSSSCTFCADCGRNGVSSALQSLIACSAVCSTVSRRAGSSLSFQGAWSERYLFASPTTRIASPIAAFCRLRESRSPTGANAPDVAASRARSSSVSWAGDGDEVAQRVGVVAGEEVAHVDDDVARGRELAALHREELAGDHLGGQV